MKVSVLQSTDNPEELACMAARNDYYDGDVYADGFEKVMQGIDGDDLQEKKETLLAHLLGHGHFGPFEHPQITFHVQGVSRSLMAQLTRHRHASFDVQSMRYVSFDDKLPQPGHAVVRIPELDTADPAGRNAEIAERYEDLSDDELLDRRRHLYGKAMENSFNAYDELLDLGVAPENARMVLPIGAKVNMVFSVNARMLMHIADMRAAADAQWEIREMTEEILRLAEEWMPLTFSYYNAEMKNRKNRLAP